MKPLQTRIVCAAVATVALAAVSSRAQNVIVTANLSDASLGGGNFAYTLTINNTGTEAVDALWLGWIPGVFNIANPTSAGNLQGWSSSPVSSSIQYAGNSGNAIAHGGTGTFTFDSTSTPAQFTSHAAGESWIYGINYSPQFGSTANADMQQFFLNVVPEPSTTSLVGLGALGLAGTLRRRLFSRQ